MSPSTHHANGSGSLPDLAPGVSLASPTEAPPTVNRSFTPQRRETADRAGAIVRQIRALSRSFSDGWEDTESLEFIREIEQATADLKATALEALSQQYSNAEIAEPLGVTRQAVHQARLRARGRRQGCNPTTEEIR